MRFSVIIPSYLGEYPTAAENRNEKIIRAIKSVLAQTFQDFEIIVIADNCPLTVAIIKENYNKHPKITGYKISYDKKGLFQGIPRNWGIDYAYGDYVVYLDIDDKFAPNYLECINSQLNGEDWVYFNDQRFKGGEFIENICDINTFGKCGTSNICHKATMTARWNIENKYSKDDWHFIQKLKSESSNYKQIDCCGYMVCHLPKQSGIGYDV